MGSLSIEGVNLSSRSIPDSPPIMGFSGTALPGAELYPEQLSMAAARIVRVIWFGHRGDSRNRTRAGGREDQPVTAKDVL
jgi:hypothetical protein